MGIVSPILVQRIDEDWVLVDGLHRVEDALAAGDQPIDVAVLDGDMADLLCRNLFLDHARGKTPVSDMVKVIGVLSKEYGLDSDKIRERTGLTRDYIEKLVKVSMASPSVTEALDQGLIGVGHAYEISRLPYAIQQEEVIAKHNVWRFKVKELREQVDGVLNAMQEMQEQPQPVAPGGSRPAPVYYCEGCREEVEPRYLRPAMVCPDCFGALWRLQKAKAETKAKNDENGGGG